MTESPVLVAVAHGTRSPAGRRCAAQLRLAIGRLRPELTVLAAQVDVHKPALPDVVARLRAQRRAMVIVPLLLSVGHHVRVDVAEAVRSSAGLAVAAPALGPDPVLAEVLADRLQQVGHRPGDAVVLAAAGTRDQDGQQAVRQVAAQLAERVAGHVQAAFLSAAQPGVAEAVAQARRTAPGVSVAGYLLAPGHFADRLHECGADRVTPVLGADERIAALAVRRFEQARHQLLGGFAAS